jgi:hypothetical protein
MVALETSPAERSPFATDAATSASWAAYEPGTLRLFSVAAETRITAPVE